MRKQIWIIKLKKFGMGTLQKTLSFSATLAVVGTPNTHGSIYLHNFFVVILALPLILTGVLIHWILGKVFFNKWHDKKDKEIDSWNEKILEIKQNKVLQETEVKATVSEIQGKLKRAKTFKDLEEIARLMPNNAQLSATQGQNTPQGVNVHFHAGEPKPEKENDNVINITEQQQRLN